MRTLIVSRIGIDRCRCPRTGHDILTLRIDEVLPVELIFAGAGIPGEGNTRSTVHAHVAKDHRLHIHRRTPLMRDLFDPPVLHRTLTVPTGEHCADTTPQLLERIIRESPTQYLLYRLFKIGDQGLEFVHRQIRVALIATGMFHGFQLLIEHLTNALTSLRLHTCRLFHHHIRIHHDQTSVGIVCETLISRLCDQSLDRFRIQSHIQDRFHHPGHRPARTGTYRQQQRIDRIPKIFAHQDFDFTECRSYLGIQDLRVCVVVSIIIGADIRRDREAWRNRQS